MRAGFPLQQYMRFLEASDNSPPLWGSQFPGLGSSVPSSYPFLGLTQSWICPEATMSELLGGGEYKQVAQKLRVHGWVCLPWASALSGQTYVLSPGKGGRQIANPKGILPVRKKSGPRSKTRALPSPESAQKGGDRGAGYINHIQPMGLGIF